MVLIDSLFINTSGGKILLDYLVRQIEEAEIDCFYLFDARCKDSYTNVPPNRKIYLKASMLNRYRFYKKRKGSFTKILCFGNLPPITKQKAITYTYFHQFLFIELPTSITGVARAKFLLKKKVFKLLIKNTDFFVLQTDFIKNKFINEFNVTEDEVKLLPFYPPLPNGTNVAKEAHTYIYVSGGAVHKNHQILINAFSEFYEKRNVGKLVLTVAPSYQKVYSQIARAQSKGIPIINLGYVSREELVEEYLRATYLIFPSLKESFGLGLIEGIEKDCKIIAADLPYTYEVCEPSLVFDPYSQESLLHALEKSLDENIKQTQPLISNEIHKLISILSE
ncbi:glycosyltransferase [Cochleicola gelatinilyticus]|uniref:Glycosyl transferase family 1 domain-containing protein n=1 Tax=Cochleicola gelatinilyticus TaxID=1763537 RepID=A0A167G8T5_9FLAO|nr:glycosyltransferase [Cochleicola gelatinilyticus]OAB77338.1 hypothetical protein ULVI_12610 [Cochleicola gelatinilyticus]